MVTCSSLIINSLLVVPCVDTKFHIQTTPDTLWNNTETTVLTLTDVLNQNSYTSFSSKLFITDLAINSKLIYVINTLSTTNVDITVEHDPSINTQNLTTLNTATLINTTTSIDFDSNLSVPIFGNEEIKIIIDNSNPFVNYSSTDVASSLEVVNYSFTSDSGTPQERDQYFQVVRGVYTNSVVTVSVVSIMSVVFTGTGASQLEFQIEDVSNETYNFVGETTITTQEASFTNVDSGLFVIYTTTNLVPATGDVRAVFADYLSATGITDISDASFTLTVLADGPFVSFDDPFSSTSLSIIIDSQLIPSNFGTANDPRDSNLTVLLGSDNTNLIHLEIYDTAPVLTTDPDNNLTVDSTVDLVYDNTTFGEPLTDTYSTLLVRTNEDITGTITQGELLFVAYNKVDSTTFTETVSGINGDFADFETSYTLIIHQVSGTDLHSYNQVSNTVDLVQSGFQNGVVSNFTFSFTEFFTEYSLINAAKYTIVIDSTQPIIPDNQDDKVFQIINTDIASYDTQYKFKLFIDKPDSFDGIYLQSQTVPVTIDNPASYTAILPNDYNADLVVLSFLTLDNDKNSDARNDLTTVDLRLLSTIGIDYLFLVRYTTDYGVLVNTDVQYVTNNSSLSWGKYNPEQTVVIVSGGSEDNGVFVPLDIDNVDGFYVRIPSSTDLTGLVESTLTFTLPNDIQQVVRVVITDINELNVDSSSLVAPNFDEEVGEQAFFADLPGLLESGEISFFINKLVVPDTNTAGFIDGTANVITVNNTDKYLVTLEELNADLTVNSTIFTNVTLTEVNNSLEVDSYLSLLISSGIFVTYDTELSLFTFKHPVVELSAVNQSDVYTTNMSFLENTATVLSVSPLDGVAISNFNITTAVAESFNTNIVEIVLSNNSVGVIESGVFTFIGSGAYDLEFGSVLSLDTDHRIGWTDNSYTVIFTNRSATITVVDSGATQIVGTDSTTVLLNLGGVPLEVVLPAGTFDTGYVLDTELGYSTYTAPRDLYVQLLTASYVDPFDSSLKTITPDRLIDINEVQNNSFLNGGALRFETVMTSGTVTFVLNGDSLELSTTNTGNVYIIPNSELTSFSGTPSDFVNENGYSIRTTQGLLEDNFNVTASLTKPVVNVSFGDLETQFDVDASNTPLTQVLTDDSTGVNMGVALRNNDGSLYWYQEYLGDTYNQTFNAVTVSMSTTNVAEVNLSTDGTFVPGTTSIQLTSSLKLFGDQSGDGNANLVFDFSNMAGYKITLNNEIVYQINLQTGTFEANLFVESTTGVYSLLRKSSPFTFTDITAGDFAPRDVDGQPLYFRFSGTTVLINDIIEKDAVFIPIDSSKIPFRIQRNIGGGTTAEAKNDIFQDTNKPAIELYFNAIPFSTTAVVLDLDESSIDFQQGEYFYVDEVENYVTGFDLTAKYLLHYNLTYKIESGTSVGFVELGIYGNGDATPFHIHKSSIYPDEPVSVPVIGDTEAGANLTGSVFIHTPENLSKLIFKNRIFSGSGTPQAILDSDNSEVFIFRLI